MQPRHPQDAADKHEVLLKTQRARDKSESAGAQGHHRTSKLSKSTANISTDGNAVIEDQQTGGSTEGHDAAFLDAQKGDGVDYIYADGPRVIRQKTSCV